MTPHDTTDSAPDEPDGQGHAPVVLQVLPRLETGGVERGTIDMAAALREAGWTPLVASEGGRMVRELERVGAEHITLPLASKNPLTLRRNATRLAELIETRGIDLVHARSRAPAWSALWAARRTGVPFVTTFHGTYNIDALGLKRRYNGVMAQGDRVIAISEFIRRHILAEYRTDPSIIRVIHRGIDFSRFDPERVSAERMIQLARKWALRDGDPVIMLPGRLTRWKGALLLVDALARLGDRAFQALLVGDPQGREDFREEVEQAIEAKGLHGRVKIVGDCNDMPAAYMISDVVVSASTDPEAFGRVAAEGQAMGRPVIAPHHGAAAEIVQDGRTGWLFVPNNADALATVLRKALDLHGPQRDALAARALEHVRARFSKQRMTDATLSVYWELLAQKFGG